MKINSINKNSTNFKAINLVQVPKKAFAAPENMLACKEEFKLVLNNMKKEEPTGIIQKLKKLLFAKSDKGIYCLFENPSYYFTKFIMELQNINYSLGWFKNNSGLPIKENLDDNYHSFYIFTGKDKSKAKKAMKTSLWQIHKIQKKAVQKYPNDELLANVYTFAGYGIDKDKKIDKLIKNNPIETIKVDNLDEFTNTLLKY